MTAEGITLHEQLQTLDEELRDLNARLREVNNLRSRIMNQNYLHVPTWDDTYPVMCTIELGGASNTMSFTGGTNAGSLNATVDKYSGFPDKLGGNTVRALMSSTNTTRVSYAVRTGGGSKIYTLLYETCT